MRLITHNLLKSNIKNVINGFPLLIEPEQIEMKPCELNQGDFLNYGIFFIIYHSTL